MINRKLNKYIIFTLVCFLSLIGITLAEENNYLSGMKFQDVRYIPSTGYDTFKCEGEGTLKVLTLEQLENSVKVVFANFPAEEGEDVVVCKWTKRDKVGGINESGEMKYPVPYHKETERNLTITINGSVDKMNQDIDIKAKLGANEIVKVEEKEGSEYINYSQCDGTDKTKCLVRPNVEAVRYEVLKSTADITYKIAETDEEIIAHITFLISINGGGRAYPGEFGTCNFNTSQWQYEERGGYEFWEVNTLNGVVFPNCGSENSAFPVEFKGWTSQPFSNTTPFKAQQTGVCTEYGLIPGETPTDITTGNNYFACYEYAPGITLVGAAGITIENIEACSTISGYTYYCSSTSNQTLPNATFTGVYNQGKTVRGWKRASDGQILAPGTSVPADGEMYTIVVDNNVTQRDYYKSILVGEKEAFVIDDMKTCSQVNGTENLRAVFNNTAHECQITGLKATDPNTYVDLLITTSDTTYTYKFTVEDNTGMSEADPNGFIIDVDPNIIYGQNDKYTNDNNFFTKTCESYTVKWSGSDVKFGNKGGTDLYSSNYNATSGCGDFIALCLDPGRLGPVDARVYNRTADIKEDSDFGKLIGYIAKKLSDDNQVTNFRNNNAYKIAALVAVRAVAIMDGYSGGIVAVDNLLDSHYNIYADLAKKLKEVYDNDFEKLSETDRVSKIKKAITDSVNIYYESNGIKALDVLVNFLVNYKFYEPSDAQSFSRTIDSTVFEEVGAGYTITYKGTFSMPNNSNLKPDQIEGFDTGNEKGTMTVTKNDDASTSTKEVWNYEVIITVLDASKVKPPTKLNGRLKYSFKLVYTGGATPSNIFIANPSGSAVAQRMLLFKIQSNEIYTYFDIAPNTENACNTLPALDYKACYDEEGNYICDANLEFDKTCYNEDDEYICDVTPSQFNPDLFKASNCCKYVLDEVKYEHIVKNVCNSNCSVSTMQNACTIKEPCTAEEVENGTCDNGASEVYTIKEGAKYLGNGQYSNQIGTCVVVVNREVNEDTVSKDVADGGLKTTDGNGNSLMVADYEQNNNKYCRISCSEEWTIAADGFGNFIGANAITAGSYFNIKTPIFIGGQRTCYTTYIDYNDYISDLSSASAAMVEAYNNYSELSHIYSAIHGKQMEYVNPGGNSYGYLIFHPVDVCTAESDEAERTVYEDDAGNSCTAGTIGCNPKKETYHTGNYTCSTYDKTTYGYYTMTVSDKFEDAAAGTGSYEVWNAHGTRSYPRGTATSTCTLNIKSGYHKVNEVGEDCLKADLESREKAYNDLAGDLTPDIGKMQGYLSAISSAKAAIKKYSQNMFDCQHFQLYNSSDDGTDKKNNTILTKELDGIMRSYVRIDTAFEPEASYTYDESPYMTILGKDNVLEEFTALNDKYYQLAGFESYAKATNQEVNAALDWYVPDKITTSDLDTLISSDINGNKSVKLSRNKIHTYYYNPSGMWTQSGNPDGFYNYHDPSSLVGADEEAPTAEVSILYCTVDGQYTGGTSTGSEYVKEGVYETYTTGGKMDPYWSGGKCSDKTYKYLRAHYIKSSISNSSFYKNKGNWYNRVNDVKEHGTTLEEAWENARKRDNGPDYSTDDPSLWSRVGEKHGINEFPISITTPRNLYQYTYTFGKIGIFGDGRLGRLMGAGSLSLISSNNRTCFYEIVESVCKCCGDPIVSYDIEGVPSPEEFIEAHEDLLDYEQSDEDKIGVNSNGTLGFTNSTVSLNDLNAVGKTGGRELSINWSDSDVYRLSSSRFHTAKGSMALEAIETVGEKVYEETPEYSFQLSPQTLASIRDYNDQYGYGVDFSRLKVYGRYAIQPLGDCSDINSCQWQEGGEYNSDYITNNVSNFKHYGSVFLEEFMNDYSISNGLSKLTNNNNVCVVNELNTYKDLLNLSNTGNCRWIDYIDSEEIKTYNPATSKYEQEIQFFRLAFK